MVARQAVRTVAAAGPESFVPQRTAGSLAVHSRPGFVVCMCDRRSMTDATTTSLPEPVDALRAREREVSAASARLLSAVVDVAADAKPGFEADEVAFALAWT